MSPLEDIDCSHLSGLLHLGGECHPFENMRCDPAILTFRNMKCVGSDIAYVSNVFRRITLLLLISSQPGL